MYGPVIFLLCARPGDDLLGAGGAILRARDQGSLVSCFMLSTGLLPPSNGLLGRLFGRQSNAERAEQVMAASRRIAVEYGHQFIGWDTARHAGGIAANIGAVARDIERAFVSLKPDVIWTPAFLGLDPDYDTLNVIASRLPQLSKTPVDVYEYIPRPIRRANLAGSARGQLVFPNKLGLELSLNLTASESARRMHAIESLMRAYDEPLQTTEMRELFRMLPQHDYARPPYGYKNGLMLRGLKPGDKVANAVIPRYLQLLRTPINRAPLLPGNEDQMPLHHLPQG